MSNINIFTLKMEKKKETIWLDLGLRIIICLELTLYLKPLQFCG